MKTPDTSQEKSEIQTFINPEIKQIDNEELQQQRRVRRLQEIFNKKYTDILKQFIKSESGKEIIMPRMRTIEDAYELLPTRLNKSINTPFENQREQLELQLSTQEEEYNILFEKYDEKYEQSNIENLFDFIDEAQLPNLDNLEEFSQLGNFQLISGDPQDFFIKTNIEQITESYPDAPMLLQKLNDRFKNKRWPFVTGLKSQDSNFMSKLLKFEKLRPLKPCFKNDFYLEFDDIIPSKSEIFKRARILAKIYCKNQLKVEQNIIQQELQGFEKILRDREELEEMEKSYQENLQQIEQKEYIKYFEPEVPVKIETTKRIPYIIKSQSEETNERILNSYNQISQWLDEKSYESYKNNNIKESIEYKRKKEQVEDDMKTIKDQDKLLRVLLMFKTIYKI